MSAVALCSQFPEEERLEIACQEELQKALELIQQLQDEVKGLRMQLAETDRIVTQKELLLCSASSHEQILRSELLRNRSQIWG